MTEHGPGHGPQDVPGDSTRSFEYLGDQPEPSAVQPAGTPRPRRSRKVLVGLTAGALVVAGAAGALAVAQFMDGGPQADTAAPADTLAWVSLDLDPSGGQKLAAYQTLKKFPAIEDQLGLTSQDDLRRWVFDGITSGSDCDVDYADVEGWLGDAMGVGMRPGEESPTVFMALEVTDTDAAGPGVRDLARCLGEDEIGTALAGDFMIVSGSAEDARSVAEAATSSALADDPTYAARTGEAGDDGIVTAYLAPSFGDFLVEQLSSLGGMFGGGMPDVSDGSGDMLEAVPDDGVVAGRAGALTEDTFEPGADPGDELQDLPDGDLGDFPMGPMGPMGPMSMLGFPGLFLGGLGGLGAFDEMTEQLKDFGGAAVQVRFADESLEIEAVSHGLDSNVPQDGTVSLADLPAGTGLAFAMATGQEWAQGAVEQLRAMDPEEMDRELAEASRVSGLDLPDDAVTMAGDSVTLAVDAGVDLSGLFEGFFTGQGDATEVPAGLRITGDPAELAPLWRKVADLAAAEGGPTVSVEEGDGAIAVGLDPAFTAELAQGGDLGGSDAFGQAVPEDGDPVVAAFADFDAQGWLDELVSEGSQEERANLAPLSAFGLTSTREGDALHAVLRLTTD